MFECCLRSAFLPACRGKGHLMDLARACDGLSPLPVKEKTISWTWCVLEMGFPPACRGKGCLMDSVCACDGLLPSACRGKGRIMDLVCACDGLPPCLSMKRPSHGLGVRSRWPLSPVCRGKICFRAPPHPPERLRKVPKSGPGAPEPKNCHFCSRFTLKTMLI